MSARKLRWRKDGRTNVSIEEACWQYLLDHSFYTNQGTFLAKLENASFETFKQSLNTRILGKYRFSEEDLKAYATKRHPERW